MWVAVFVRDYDCDTFVIPCSTQEVAEGLAEEFDGHAWEAPAVDYRPPTVKHYTMGVPHWAPEGQPRMDTTYRPTEAKELVEPVWPDKEPFVAPELQKQTAVAHWMPRSWDPVDIPRQYWPYVDLWVYGPDRESVETLFNETLDQINADWPRSWFDLAQTYDKELEIARTQWGRGLRV